MIYENPDFPEQFTDGAAKFAATKAGVRSFEKLAALTPYYNEDYLACTYNDACDMLANGEGAHYFIQSNCLNTISSLYGQETANGIDFLQHQVIRRRKQEQPYGVRMHFMGIRTVRMWML